MFSPAVNVRDENRENQEMRKFFFYAFVEVKKLNEIRTARYQSERERKLILFLLCRLKEKKLKGKFYGMMQ